MMPDRDRDRAVSALFHLSPTCCREEWVRAGMGAKAAGLDFEEFHEWSKFGGNYAGEAECRTTWKSFNPDGTVQAGTLFSMAFAQGWKDPKGMNGHSAIVPATKPAQAAPRSSIQAIAASTKAAHIWRLCDPAPPDHGYILSKRGVADGVRMYPRSAPPLQIAGRDMAGWLVVPCWDGDALQTLQFIPPGEDNKLNLPGASFGNGFFYTGEIAPDGRVFICEGIGQAWTCAAVTGAAAVACFGVGRMATVAAALHKKLPAARLVLVPDRGKECQCEAIARAVDGAWCELPAELPNGNDINDLSQFCEHQEVAALLDRAKTPLMRYKLLTAAELWALPPLRWLLRGVLPRQGLAALYGASGSGKSFLILALAAALAGGAVEWFGRRLTSCVVVYVILEGEMGFPQRVKAWTVHHGKPPPPGLHFVVQPFTLLNIDDVAELAKAILAAGGANGLVVLDTLSRAAPGVDENSFEAMSSIIAAAKELQTLTGGLVLLVHHTGKDAAKGLRGHSSLHGALDAAIEVTRDGACRTWCASKSKDGSSETVHAFKLEIVTVGHDDNGEEITSCVAVTDDSTTTIKRVALPTGANEKTALAALGEPLRQSTEFGKDGAPPYHPCIRLECAVELVAERLTCEPKRRFVRARGALAGLVAKRIYGVKGEWLWRN